MLHCKACDAMVPPWDEYCSECKEAISEVYVEDSAFVKYVKGIHPRRIPSTFCLCNIGFMFDEAN